jgi:chemotaxis protein MotB
VPPPPPQGGRRRVVKKIAGHGHHGGAWKIAYADFVTAMMALFMVLWLLASTDQKSREEISRYFRTGILPDGELAMNGGAQHVPSIIERAPTPPPPNQQTIDDEIKTLREAIEHVAQNHVELAEIATRVRVVATDDGLLIEIVDDDGGEGLLFDTASSELKPALVEFLEGLAPVLQGRRETIEIHGHSDARPFAPGAQKSNWELSFERAAEARKVLEAAGVAPTRVVGVIGRGAAVPLDPQNPFAAQNRRLSVLLRYRPPALTRLPPISTTVPAQPP